MQVIFLFNTIDIQIAIIRYQVSLLVRIVYAVMLRELMLTDKDRMKVWVEHYAKQPIVEFEQLSKTLPEVPPTAGASISVSAAPICKTLNKIKCSMTAGPSGIVVEMLKAAGEEGVGRSIQLFFSCFP